MLLFRSQLLVCLLALHLSQGEDRRNAILSALEGAAGFLEEHYDDIIIDTLLGYSMMKASLSGALEKWSLEPGLESEKERGARLEEKISAWIIKAKDSLKNKESDEHQVNLFRSALKPGFWKVPHRWTQTNSSETYSALNDSCNILKESNNCISFLLGTWEDGGEPCIVPDVCRRFVTTAHCSGYSLSHQLLYLLFAEMQGCSDPLLLQAQHYKRGFCNSMMLINNNFEKQSNLSIFADLFTENIFFCGFAGFSDFYKPQWLDLILHWQKPGKGCFWMYDASASDFKNFGREPRRTKRSEKIIQGECSSHNTAVAVGALGGFLYYGF